MKSKKNKPCEHLDHPEHCKCKAYNEISMDIAQDLWNSCAKHLGEDCGIESENVFMITVVALASFIEHMAESGRDQKGNPATVRDVLSQINMVYVQANEYSERLKNEASQNNDSAPA